MHIAQVPGAEVIDVNSLGLDPLQEQQVLLATESSLQALLLFCEISVTQYPRMA